ncbi:hypothetical protein LUX29_04460 [Aureimonas altamirensis]|uniref:hypothetical protein n=1 Tax=Aureimonas altamirensis TaxID=370622 RepID=UPI001E5E1D41|nr:hypothetical protein [Aureimonas altamirensis]UHD46477.1 hypothetical protein LUX29_04460 [Aureimonas altamirensis]
MLQGKPVDRQEDATNHFYGITDGAVRVGCNEADDKRQLGVHYRSFVNTLWAMDLVAMPMARATLTHSAQTSGTLARSISSRPPLSASGARLSWICR